MTKNVTAKSHTMVSAGGGVWGSSGAPPSGGTAALGWSAPAGLAAGGILVITTDGTFNFGTQGPNVALYDDYAGGVAGNAIANNHPLVGLWLGNLGNYSPAIFANGGRDGSTCGAMFNAAGSSTQKVRNNRANLGAAVSEVFACWSTMFPGGITGSGTPGVWPASSHLKNIWFSHGDAIESGDGNDIVLYSHSSQTASTVVGNDSSDTVYFDAATKSQGNYDFAGWNVYESWLKGGPNPMVDKSTVYGCLSNANHKGEQTRTDGNPFDPTDGVLDRVQFPGWFGNLNSSEVGFNPLVDDLYVAYGPGSPARMILGDAPTWAAVKQRWLAPPITGQWGQLAAQCRIPKTLSGIQGLFLYVRDGNNGLVNANGVLI